MQFNGADIYTHYTICSHCGRENYGANSKDANPWEIGAAWCPRCRVVFTILPGRDRVVLSPTQLTLFS
jgi:hypothetical protein